MAGPAGRSQPNPYVRLALSRGDLGTRVFLSALYGTCIPCHVLQECTVTLIRLDGNEYHRCQGSAEKGPAAGQDSKICSTIHGAGFICGLDAKQI